MDTDLWTRINDRPQAVRTHREQILDATSDSVADAMPGPADSTHAYRQFLNSHKGVVTRQLDDPDDAEEGGE